MSSYLNYFINLGNKLIWHFNVVEAVVEYAINGFSGETKVATLTLQFFGLGASALLVAQ